MADEAPAAAAPSAPPATPAAPTDGALPPQPAATEAPKAPVTPADAIAQIEGSDDYAALEAALDKSNEKPAETPAAEATPAAPTTAPATAATQPDGSQPPASPAPAAAAPGSDDPDNDSDETLPKNFRFHVDNDPARARFLQLVRREPGANPIDLAVRAGYALPTTATPAAAPAAAAAAPAETIETTLKPMRDEIDALQAQKKAAREAYEFDKVDEIADQILEKRLALEKTKADLEQQASYSEEYNSVKSAARAEAWAKYPDTRVPGTPQFEEVQREVAHLENVEAGFFDDPRYPIELLTRLEKRRPDLFKSGAAPAPAAAAPAAAPAPSTVTPPPNAAAKLPARPVGQVAAGTEGSLQPLTKQATEQAIEEMTDPEEIAKLADLVGTPAGRGGSKRR